MKKASRTLSNSTKTIVRTLLLTKVRGRLAAFLVFALLAAVTIATVALAKPAKKPKKSKSNNSVVATESTLESAGQVSQEQPANGKVRGPIESRMVKAH